MAATAAVRTPQQLWERGNTLYTNGDYNGAIAAYDSIVNQGLGSAKLYYNLGNAYFKAGRTGKAIVFYNRALKLAPSDSDTAYNLAYANTYVKDKIDAVPEFFVARWVRSLRNLLGSNAWAVISLVLLALTLALTGIYLLSERRRVRKAGFFSAIAALILTIITFSFAATERHAILDSSEAIVLSSAVSVKSSPDRTSKDIFILHEGTKVTVLDRFGDWTEIRIADGNEGWVVNSSIETIN